ncbi:hypothetical protein MVEN_02408800 [Mycena venus]|uniref:F-box domain-containing protein n=1 Tax=Mycena venus TaxID=2733690 RepID=A0A8H7CDB6_9AGAR|nr:hypothetical protein MVEN_02408800 [Mycena venus]
MPLDALGPIFPLDLEREIFEVLAHSHLPSIPKLVLVARRVQLWMEPLLYRNLSVVQDDFRVDFPNSIRIPIKNCLEVGYSRPSFLRDHVHHLAFTNLPSDAIARILSRCTGVVRLGMFQTEPHPTYLPSISCMSLHYLSVDINRLFHGVGGAADFDHPAFAALTHLDLFAIPFTDDWVTGLCRLPRLTHLSFNIDETSARDVDAFLFRRILVGCKSLEALILIFVDEDERVEFGGRYRYFCNDLRSVTAVVEDFLEDWERGATGGEDYWVRADQFIQKRRIGDVKGSIYSIPHSPLL